MKPTRNLLLRGSNCLTCLAIWLIAPSLLTPGLYAQRPALFSSLLGGSGQDYATSVTSDVQGNIYVAGLTYSNDFPVTPGTFQTKFGGTCDAFIAKLGPDGKLIWSTYLGGILDDWATALALDSAGNILVAGYTRSANFPLANPSQSALDNGASDDYDAFIAKLDPNGARLLYSTFLGGQADDGAVGLAVDSTGNAYVAVNANSPVGFPGGQNATAPYGIFVGKLSPQGALAYSYFHPYGSAGGIALDASGAAYVAGSVPSFYPSGATETFGPPGSAQAIVFQISPDGSKKIYETAIGGSVQANASAVVVNAAGEAYIAGWTSSVDFPLVHSLQSSLGARPLFKSADSATTWNPIDDLPFALPQMIVADPITPTTVYAATGDLGVFKSVDSGATWAHANNGIASTNVAALAVDPVHPQTLYAATGPSLKTTSSAVYKSTDGGNTWSSIDSVSFSVLQLAVDAQNSNTVYEVGTNIRKSLDAGATWNAVTFPGTVASFALDPRVSGHIFAVSNLVFCGVFCANNQIPLLYRSVDGGANWIQVALTVPAQPGLTVDASTNPSTIYNGLSSRSLDGGVTWAPITGLPFASSNVSAFAFDPGGNLYVAPGAAMFLSRDRGQTWMTIGSPTSPAAPETFSPAITAIVPAGSSGAVFATLNQIATSGFTSKLSADGSTLEYSTYLGGHASTQPFPIFAAEPSVMLNQNWISSIALDPAGNIVVAGGTRAADFPLVNAAQAANAGHSDAFAATISADGSQLNYSSYFGGSGDDGGLAVGLDSQGNTILAGQTWSYDFPASIPTQQPFGYGDAFVVKLATAPPSITAVVNGASYQPGIEAGSWVTIKGRNLANSTRTWASADIVNGTLPTSLDGVSVSIDGKPAFVEYISPTQINVQAPSDSAVGKVNVVVNNNGSPSAPAPAQLQTVAPAFFLYGATNYAAANRLPDYAPVADPSVVPGAVAANPGDTIVLWGTGFGATNPPVAAGTTVSGAPAVLAPLTVTVGGASAQVIGAVPAPGDAGLYKVTIQLPANVAAGAVPVEASVGGVLTSAGVTIYLATH